MSSTPVETSVKISREKMMMTRKVPKWLKQSMTELSVEEEYDEQAEGVEETDTENQEYQPLFLTEDDIPQ